jgi:hypothetical protein
MSREDKSKTVEQGDIFFFYRPKVGTEEVSNIGDIQRFYMVTVPETKDRKYTLLPQIIQMIYAKSLLQLNMKQKQEVREEWQQLHLQEKANTPL